MLSCKNKFNNFNRLQSQTTVSISGDIFITIKNSDKFENVLTPINEWIEL